MYRPTDWPTDTRSWSVTVVVVMYVIDTNTYTHPQPSPSSRRHTTVSWLTNTVYTVRYGSHLLIDSGMLFVPTSCTSTACCTFSCPSSLFLWTFVIPSCCCCCCCFYCCRHCRSIVRNKLLYCEKEECSMALLFSLFLCVVTAVPSAHFELVADDEAK